MLEAIGRRPIPASRSNTSLLQRLSFGGKVSGRTLGVDHRSPGRLRLANLRANPRALRDRLETVTIERLPMTDFIRRYDSPGTLFYIDPPYWN